jgi:hypothetical protein
LNPAAPERTKTKTAFKKKQKQPKRKPALTLLIAVRLPAEASAQAGRPAERSDDGAVDRRGKWIFPVVAPERRIASYWPRAYSTMRIR